MCVHVCGGGVCMYSCMCMCVHVSAVCVCMHVYVAIVTYRSYHPKPFSPSIFILLPPLPLPHPGRSVFLSIGSFSLRHPTGSRRLSLSLSFLHSSAFPSGLEGYAISPAHCTTPSFHWKSSWDSAHSPFFPPAQASWRGHQGPQQFLEELGHWP